MMKKISTVLNHVRVEVSKKNYNKALDLLESIKNEKYLPAIYYLMKYTYIHLSDRTCYSFLDMRRCLEKALALEPYNIDAMVELGYFYSRLMADDEKAMPYFLKACDLARDMYVDALVGIIEMEKEEYANFLDKNLTELRKAIKDKV
jgi:tetratricopeptide (TPR) repeat protein